MTKLGGFMIFRSASSSRNRMGEKKLKQAGTELGQAQLKLELHYTLIFCRFGLIELTGW